MKRFIEGADRSQSTLLPECLDDWVEESNPVRVVDVFVDALDLAELSFKDVEPAVTGRPGYHALLKDALCLIEYEITFRGCQNLLIDLASAQVFNKNWDSAFCFSS
jgi:transposase